MPTDTKLSQLSDGELRKLLALIGGSDSVELKATLAEGERQQAITALGLDPLEAQIRQVFFFDTPDLLLHRNGVTVRARRIQGREGDSVVKLRPALPNEVTKDSHGSVIATVEVDVMPGGYVCSATIKRRVPNATILEAASGEQPLRKLFSKQQRTFFSSHAPEGIRLDELCVLGPVLVHKLVLEPRTFGRRIVAEHWLLPDGPRILELSTKCQPSEASQIGPKTRAYLESLGLDLHGDPQTKTMTTLEFFASALARLPSAPKSHQADS
jgi:hypothetical protein